MMKFMTKWNLKVSHYSLFSMNYVKSASLMLNLYINEMNYTTLIEKRPNIHNLISFFSDNLKLSLESE